MPSGLWILEDAATTRAGGIPLSGFESFMVRKL
jgi:hypothetical protein